MFFDQPFASGAACTLEGAWVDREDDYSSSGVATRSIDGYYVQAGWLLGHGVGPGQLQVVARYEDFDADRSFSLNYYLRSHDRKLQLEYTTRRAVPVVCDNNAWILSLVNAF